MIMTPYALLIIGLVGTFILSVAGGWAWRDRGSFGGLPMLLILGAVFYGCMTYVAMWAGAS